MKIHKLKKRYTLITGENQDYVLDRYIFQSVIVVMILLFILTIISNGGLTSGLYIYCPANGPPCDNPVYEAPDTPNVWNAFGAISSHRWTVEEKKQYKLPEYVYKLEILEPGFKINEPPWLVSNYVLIVCLLVVVGLFINHLVHNRDFDFKKMAKDIKEDENDNNGKTFD